MYTQKMWLGFTVDFFLLFLSVLFIKSLVATLTEQISVLIACMCCAQCYKTIHITKFKNK